MCCKGIYLSLFVVIGCLTMPSIATESDLSDGESQGFQIISADMDRFSRMIEYWQLGNPESNLKLLRAQYLQPASYGLNEFFRIKIRDERKFASVVESLLPHFKTLDAYTFDVTSLRPELERMFERFSAWTDDAQPLDVYFVVGRFSSAGTVTNKGILIGVEHYAWTVPAASSAQGYKFKAFETMSQSIAHEYIHSLQHQAGPKTLIRAAIFEGGADFLAALATDTSLAAKESYQYGMANERAVWQRFERDMHATDVSQWIANSKTREWPADMGYFVGYQIAKRFYENMKDKRAAFRHLTYVADPNFILLTSQYGSQFQ